MASELLSSVVEWEMCTFVFNVQLILGFNPCDLGSSLVTSWKVTIWGHWSSEYSQGPSFSLFNPWVVQIKCRTATVDSEDALPCIWESGCLLSAPCPGGLQWLLAKVACIPIERRRQVCEICSQSLYSSVPSRLLINSAWLRSLVPCPF